MEREDVVVTVRRVQSHDFDVQRHETKRSDWKGRQKWNGLERFRQIEEHEATRRSGWGSRSPSVHVVEPTYVLSEALQTLRVV